MLVPHPGVSPEGVYTGAWGWALANVVHRWIERPSLGWLLLIMKTWWIEVRGTGRDEGCRGVRVSTVYRTVGAYRSIQGYTGEYSGI